MNDSKKLQNSNPIFDPLVECYGRSALTGFASFWFGIVQFRFSKFKSVFEIIFDFQYFQHHIFCRNRLEIELDIPLPVLCFYPQV